MIEQSILDRLRQLSRNQGATLFMTLLAAFNVLLSRYSGQEDLVVGSPIAGRNRPEIEKLIGFFVNTLVLRTDLSGNPSFLDLLRRVRETSLGAYAHQDIPFERLVEELNPERDLSRNPLFQIMFTLQNVPREKWQLPGLTLSPFQMDSGIEKFDLSVNLVEKANGLKASFRYNTDLFEPTTIGRMCEHFQKLLEGIVANPEERVGKLPLLSGEDRQQLLVEWNQTKRAYPQATIQELFEGQAAKTPEAIAVIFNDQQLTYRELNRRANQLGHQLRKWGAGPDVRVGISVERSPEMIVGLLGILKAGAAYVPLDASYPKERLAFMMQDAGVEILLTGKNIEHDVSQHDTRVILLDELSLSDSENCENFRSGATLDNLAYLTYTSGSTGVPKGVEIPHRGVVRLLFGGGFAALDEKQVLLQLAPLAFDASTLEIWGALLHGGCCVLFPEKNLTAHQLGETLRKHQISTLWLTTSLFNAVIDEAPGELASVRQLLVGGEALSVPHVRRALELLPRTELINGYGPTESTTFTTTYRITGQIDPTLASIPIGRPIGNTQVYILDRYQQPVPIGVPGELHIGGDGLARGYLNRRELTEEKFITIPFSADPSARVYRSGDLARFLPDGNIQYLGRMDNQVKIRGFRIELGEIESVLQKHLAVESAVVIAREDRPGEKSLIAYVVSSTDREVSIADLRSFVKASLPEYMIPRTFVKLKALPLTPSGKINRRALPKPDTTSQASASAVAPRDDFEVVLLRLWQRVLGIDSIGMTDNFFELGGHSLMAVRLLAEIKNVTGKEIPLAALFQGATIEYLATLLRDGTQSVPHLTVMEIQRGDGSLPPFFAVPLPGVNALGYLRLAKHMGPDQPFYKLQGAGPLNRHRPYTPREFEDMAANYIQAMRAVQPEGPYYIGGMCGGARIAFDMARLLEAQGQKVGLLAVFDTWVIENSQRRLFWLLYYYQQRLRAFRRLPLAEKRKMLLQTLRNKLKHWSKETNRENEFRVAYWPGKDFKPPKYGGQITVFKIPKQPFYYVRDPLMGWGTRTTAGVNIQLVEGEHVSVLREPHVQVLAQKLSACLKQAHVQAADSHTVSSLVVSHSAGAKN